MPMAFRLAGSVFSRPSGLGLMHNDNVFATSDFEQSDLVAVVQPELKLTSESSRHRATLGAEADLGRYSDFDGEDYDDFDIYAEGGVDDRQWTGAGRNCVTATNTRSELPRRCTWRGTHRVYN